LPFEISDLAPARNLAGEFEIPKDRILGDAIVHNIVNGAIEVAEDLIQRTLNLDQFGGDQRLGVGPKSGHAKSHQIAHDDLILRELG
jgi:hypothetical protein